jgi:hypothetical protein
VIYVASIVIGLALGTLIRWWALLAAAAFGIWIALTTSVDEVPEWLLGLGYALLISCGIAVGVAARRALRATKKSEQASLD